MERKLENLSSDMDTWGKSLTLARSTIIYKSSRCYNEHDKKMSFNKII